MIINIKYIYSRFTYEIHPNDDILDSLVLHVNMTVNVKKAQSISADLLLVSSLLTMYWEPRQQVTVSTNTVLLGVITPARPDKWIALGSAIGLVLLSLTIAILHKVSCTGSVKFSFSGFNGS